MGEWRNWQTRTVQGRVGAIPWRFKSSLAHKIYKNVYKNKNK